MSSSIQYALLRIRPPRVQITYDVEIGNAIEKKELPFLVGILADLAGENSSKLVDLKERAFVEIDRDNFNAVVASLNPKVSVTIKDMLTAVAEGEERATKRISLTFNSIDDFGPYQVASQLPELKQLLDTRAGLVDLVAKIDGNDILVEKIAEIIADSAKRDSVKGDEGAIKQILDDAKVAYDDSNFAYLKGLFISLTNALEGVEPQQVKDEYGFLMGLISKIDTTVSTQLDEIMHAPEFQKLEASWRGMQFLVFNTETSTRLKLRLLCLSKQELINDLDKAIEFDQSALFKKIYEQEYGTLGGTPYSCLLGDFSFGRNAPDIKLLRQVATLAAAAHAPFIGAVDPNMFGIENFGNLAGPRDLAKIFESSELASWNSFREIEDSRYVNLLLPRVLMRLPYGPNTKPCEEFNYEEVVDGTDNSKFCWGNPAFVMAHRITTAFAQFSWTSAIRGVEGGGKVENLPAYTFKTTNGDVELKCPSEVAITDRREKELSDLGFIALCHAKGTDYSVFFGSQSTQKPKKYNLPAATANAAISARLPYLLNASRFAHYVKVMMRDKIGSFMTAANVESYLQNWIADYVLLSDDASQELKAQYPLREAKITVVEVPGAPGAYKAVMFLRPHFQLEELTVSMRLVAQLGG